MARTSPSFSRSLLFFAESSVADALVTHLFRNGFAGAYGRACLRRLSNVALGVSQHRVKIGFMYVDERHAELKHNGRALHL